MIKKYVFIKLTRKDISLFKMTRWRLVVSVNYVNCDVTYINCDVGNIAVDATSRRFLLVF